MSSDTEVSLQDEAERLLGIEWPILEASRAVFADTDSLIGRPLRELAQYAERDPGFALRLVRRANASRRGLRQEVHAVGDAISMLGLQNVRQEALDALGVEDAVASPRDYRHLAAQSRLAAMIATEIARERRDTEPGEVAFAALLNQLGLLALLIAGEPRMQRLIESLELNALPDEASYVALGYATDDLSRVLAERMELPELIQGMLRATNTTHARASEVMVAGAIAWQVFHGMNTVRGDRDLRRLGELLGVTEKVAADRVSACITRFNAEAALYERAPLNPQTPGRVWLQEPYRMRLALAPRADILEDGIRSLQEDVQRVSRLKRMLAVMQFGLGLNRVVFARLSRSGETLRAEHLVGTLHDPEFSDFAINRLTLGPLGHVLEEPSPQWWERQDIQDRTPPEVHELTGGVECFLGRVCEGDRVLGMVYADRRTSDLALTTQAFEGFQRILRAASRPAPG